MCIIKKYSMVRLSWGRQTFFRKGQIVKILGFVGRLTKARCTRGFFFYLFLGWEVSVCNLEACVGRNDVTAG